MKDEVTLSLKKLKQAVKRLREVLARSSSDVIRDAAIQRFEFTFELVWKTLKIILEDKGILASTPKDCFREAVRLGWITNEKVYMEMLKARNTMSHLYDEQEARHIYKQIRHRFLKPILSLLAEIDKNS